MYVSIAHKKNNKINKRNPSAHKKLPMEWTNGFIEENLLFLFDIQEKYLFNLINFPFFLVLFCVNGYVICTCNNLVNINQQQLNNHEM